MKTLITEHPNENAEGLDFVALELDPAGVLTVGYNSPTGFVPDAVKYGKVLRFPFKAPFDQNTLISLMDALTPLAQRILDGSDVEWKGNVFHGTGRFEGVLNKDATEAYEEALVIAKNWEAPDAHV